MSHSFWSMYCRLNFSGLERPSVVELLWRHIRTRLVRLRVIVHRCESNQWNLKFSLYIEALYRSSIMITAKLVQKTEHVTKLQNSQLVMRNVCTKTRPSIVSRYVTITLAVMTRFLLDITIQEYTMAHSISYVYSFFKNIKSWLI